MNVWPGRTRAGVSLIEVLVAASVASIILLAIGSFIASSFTSTTKAKDRSFAQAKATQILEEVLAFKPPTPTDDISQFDAEGLQFRLTTANVAANAPLSGNQERAGFYKFVRQVDVTAVTGDANSRLVNVKIWYAKRDSTPQIDGTKPLATATGMVRSATSIAGGVQVIPVYALSIENLPHVYRNDNDADHQYLPSAREARKAFEASLGRIEASNAWLKFKVTYIQRLSVGRDTEYRPYMNDAKPVHGTSGTRDPLDYVYLYPGKIGTASGSTSYYFDPDIVKGNLAVDRAGTVTNQGAYPMADQFNHAVRFADEFDDDDPHAAYGDTAPEPIVPTNYASNSTVSQLSLRQFLEDLLTDTSGKYRNAMLVNLHGELLPALPLRNYADPAKMPDETDAVTRERRVVTHPYKLGFEAGEPVTLLTHAWLDDGGYQPSDTSSDSGRNVNVYPGWAGNHAATHAVIVIKDIRDYLDDWGIAPLTGVPLVGNGTPDQNDVHIQTVQRERTDGSTTNAKYTLVDAWPQSLAALAGNQGEDVARNNHSGPHVNEHSNSNHDHVGSPKGPHHVPAFGDHGHVDYTNGDIDDDDLVIKVSDLRFDARQTTDGTSLFGIKGTSSAYDRDHTLYGRAYIPDPFLPFMNLASGTAAVTEARNTAQVIIQFKLNSAAEGKRFKVVTKLWDLSTDAVAVASTKPEATSTTWVYYGHAWDATRKLYWDSVNGRPSIPWTDQVQLVGDPRHNPYADLRKHGMVNRYFDDFTAGQAMYAMDEVTNLATDETKCLDAINPLLASDYTALAPAAVGAAFDGAIANSATSWNGVKYNAPEYFRMWREALMRNNMVFVSPSGEPIGLLGLGGEFKLDGQIDSLPALTISGKPWLASGDAGGEANELFPSTNDGTQFIVRSDASDARIWTNIPWLGELYPSNYHTAATSSIKWGASGNLPAGRAAINVFYRETIQNLPDAIWSYATDKTNAENGKRLLNNLGLAAFVNGTLASGGTPLDVDEAGTATGTLTSTGTTGTASLRMSLPGSDEAKFSFATSGGEEPPEWAVAPYDAKLGLDWLLPSSVTPRVYYQHESAASTHAAVAPLLLKDVFSGAPTKVAVVVPSTLRTRSAAQMETVLDVANVAGTEAYFDATRLDLGENNVKALPRIRITAPAIGATSAVGSVDLEWYGKWTRADGRPFSAFYPNGDTYPFTPSTGEPLDSVFFVKYRSASSQTWYTAKLTTPASAKVTCAAGVPSYDSTVNPIATAANSIVGSPYATENTATWDTSALSAGSYVLRVEAFRTTDPLDRTKTLPGCHAYQEIDVTLN